jgi:hypothetical protein
VHEHVVPAFIRLNKAIALLRVEPFHDASGHSNAPKRSQAPDTSAGNHQITHWSDNKVSHGSAVV